MYLVANKELISPFCKSHPCSTKVIKIISNETIARCTIILIEMGRFECKSPR